MIKSQMSVSVRNLIVVLHELHLRGEWLAFAVMDPFATLGIVLWYKI